MDTSTYVSLSGQLALERRMATLAQNVANARSAGYRAAQVNFGSIISTISPIATAFASTGRESVSMEAGGLTRTGNPLDIAVKGDGFFAIQGPDQVYYSRDGRMTLSPEGQLVNSMGHLLLDSGGAAVQVDPKGGPIDINSLGRVMQDGQLKATIGLYAVDTSAGYSRMGDAGLVPKTDAQPMTDFTRNGVVQGYVEEANVNPVMEMVRLIQVTRAFEAVSTMAEKSQDTQRNAISVLAGRG